MAAAHPDLASSELWQRSLARSHARRGLIRPARRIDLAAAPRRDLIAPELWERSRRRSRARREADELRLRTPVRAAGVSLAVATAVVAVPGASVAAAHGAGRTATATAALHRGSRGSAVAALQRALGVSADGVFGPRTRRAVRAFQARHGLAVDGVVGPQTRRALGIGAGAGRRSSRHRSRRGRLHLFRAPWVAAVQRALGVSADGVFGPQTERAVRAFQARHGLAVDGVVGPRTRRALGIGGSSSATHRYRVHRTASSLLERIARCESGGNPRAVSSGGRYRGKYQFTYATWHSLGGRGDPARAREAEQDRLAAKLLAREGTSPWPACGR